MDVLADGAWENLFTEKPEPLTREEKARVAGHAAAAFPWAPMRSSRLETTSSAPIRRGVQYIAEPGGSIRDDHVIDTCNKYGIVNGLYRRCVCSTINAYGGDRDENFGHWRRRARARDYPQAEGKPEGRNSIYCAPGNGGISKDAECVAISAMDMHGAVAFAKGKPDRFGLRRTG